MLAKTTKTLCFALVALALTAATANAQGVLFVKDDKVGIGIDTPVTPLHVVDTTAGFTELARFTNNGVPGVYYENTANGTLWGLQPTSTGHFTITLDGTGSTELQVRMNGNLVVKGTVIEGSSREIKERFAELDHQEVLERVAELEVLEWSYTDQSERHIGPIAEDFHKVFGLGENGQGLAPRDVAGVSLVAIKGLNEVVQQKNKEIERLSNEMAELRAAIRALESK